MTLEHKKIAFLKNVFNDFHVNRDGTEISVRCPKCGKPGKSKLCIRLDNEIYHCWVCDLKGRGIARVVGLVSASKRAKYSQMFPQKNEKVEEQKEKFIELPDDYRLLAEPTKDPYQKEVLRYAKLRGFTEDLLWKFRCGFSRDRKWYRRLLIPSFNEEGQLNFLTGRAIDPQNNFRYVNESIPKSEIVFNEIDVDFTRPLVLVEGPLDLVKCNFNATCLLGSTLSSDSALFERIIRNNTPIILLLDNDAKIKAMKIAKLLSSFSIDVQINFPLKSDVGDCTIEEVSNLIAQSKRFSKTSLIKTRLQGLKL